MDQWKVILATLMIFGSGIGTGYLLSRSSPPESKRLSPNRIQSGNEQRSSDTATEKTRPVRPIFFRSSGYLDRHLKLSEEQKIQIQDINKMSHQRIYDFGKPFRDQLRLEEIAVQKQIRQVLTPDQKGDFDQLPHSRFSKEPGRPPGRPVR
tara:strand:+ start:454 stop:906 length:453 start_codon:yes stop_codon:yes gene_type:complete